MLSRLHKAALLIYLKSAKKSCTSINVSTLAVLELNEILGFNTLNVLFAWPCVPLSFSAPASPEVCYHHKAQNQLPSVHPLWPNKQLVLLSTMTHSHLCSIKISITHNGKRFTAPKHYTEISEVKTIKATGTSLSHLPVNYLIIYWGFILKVQTR